MGGGSGLAELGWGSTDGIFKGASCTLFLARCALQGMPTMAIFWRMAVRYAINRCLLVRPATCHWSLFLDQITAAAPLASSPQLERCAFLIVFSRPKHAE